MLGRTENVTCQDFVLPGLHRSGWEPAQIRHEYRVQADRTIVLGGSRRVIEAGRADYVLEIVPGLPVAVIEAKREFSSPGQGLQQSIEYAMALDLPIALASDGHSIIERDLSSGTESPLEAFPTPAEVWSRYLRYHRLSPPAEHALRQNFNRDLSNPDASVKELRYYQRVAVHRLLRALIGGGEDRALVLMATGARKTFTALQLVHKLMSYWKLVEPDRNWRVLYLADRDILIKQPLGDFRQVFGDGAIRIQGNMRAGREIYFATYQALAQDGDAETLFRQYPADFFDLVIVDECHRGSAAVGSSWRAILDHFSSAIHVGFTATPRRDENVNTYAYFGDPVYEYSLRQGIEDGYLAPYRVRRVVLSADAEGWSPAPSQRDRFGREVPEGLYTTRDFERIISLLGRTWGRG